MLPTAYTAISPLCCGDCFCVCLGNLWCRLSPTYMYLACAWASEDITGDYSGLAGMDLNFHEASQHPLSLTRIIACSGDIYFAFCRTQWRWHRAVYFHQSFSLSLSWLQLWSQVNCLLFMTRRTLWDRLFNLAPPADFSHVLREFNHAGTNETSRYWMALNVTSSKGNW